MFKQQRIHWILCLGVLCGLVFLPLSIPCALAEYPTKKIHWVVPSKPGGFDIFIRTMAHFMQEEKIVDVPIIVENRPGGGRVIGLDHVASKRGNPYYLLGVTVPDYHNILLKLARSSFDDFTFIAQMVFDPNLVMVRPDFEYQSLDELLEAAKKNPGKLRWGGSGPTGADRLLCLELERVSGGKFNFIPFESGEEPTMALLGKHIDIISNQMYEAYSQLMGNKVKAPAISAEERSKYRPNLPTVKELGYDIVVGAVRGAWAPADIPDEAKEYLYEAFKKLDAHPRWEKEYIAKYQMQRSYRAGPTFKKYLEEKLIPMYMEAFKAAGLLK